MRKLARTLLLTTPLLGAALPALAIEGGTSTNAFGQVSNGVQIAPNWLLTAGHIWMNVGDTFNNGYGSSVVAERYNLPGTFPENDLSLVRLVDAIDAPSLSLVANSLTPGVGYTLDATMATGRNQFPRGYAFTQVREFMPLIDPDDSGPATAVMANFLITYFDGHAGPHVQGGDSGSALFYGQVTDSTSPLWGITSAEIYDEDENGVRTNYASGFVQLASYRSWIDGIMASDLTDNQVINWVVVEVPEASTTAMLAMGLLTLAWLGRRSRRNG